MSASSSFAINLLSASSSFAIIFVSASFYFAIILACLFLYYYSYMFLPLLLLFLSVSPSCFTLTVPMREVYCVGYTPCAREVCTSSRYRRPQLHHHTTPLSSHHPTPLPTNLHIPPYRRPRKRVSAVRIVRPLSIYHVSAVVGRPDHHPSSTSFTTSTSRLLRGRRYGLAADTSSCNNP